VPPPNWPRARLWSFEGHVDLERASLPTPQPKGGGTPDDQSRVGPRPSLGARVRQFRLRLGLSQDDLARRAGVGVATLAALERGRRERPHPRTLKRLADALGLTGAERLALIGGSPTRIPASSPHHVSVNELGTKLSPLVGRQEALSEVLALLQTARLVTLTGPGGIGKTRLALAVADASHRRHPQSLWPVFLGPIGEPALVAQTVAGAVGAPERRRGSPLTSVIEALHDRHGMLLLDNCEHLVQACAELVEILLTQCPLLTIIATSREPLRVRGEVRWGVPALGLPARPAPPADQLATYEAVRFFVERAVASRPQFRLTDANAAAVAEVCWKLDGIPLALELAAGWIATLSAEQIASRLDDRFHLLVGGSRTAPPRHQTLRAAIQWSYELLTRSQRRLFASLSVFASGWTLPAAEAVCSDEVIAREDVLRLLHDLVDKSQVRVDETAEGTRYRFLDTLHAYSRERARIDGVFFSARKKHLDWCLDVAESSAPELIDSGHIARLECEQDNLRAALRGCVEVGDVEAGLRLGVALWPFWYVRGLYTEGFSWLAQLLGMDSLAIGPMLRTRALAFAGHLAFCRGDYTTAESLLEQSLVAARAGGDEQGMAVALQLLGTPARARGDLARAEQLYLQAGAIDARLGSRVWQAMTLGNLAMTCADGGDYTRALTFASDALRMYAEQRHAWGVARMREVIARVAVSRGEYGLARRELEDAVAFQRQLQDRQGLLLSLPTLARLALAEGEPRWAAELIVEGLRLAQQADDKLSLAKGLEAVAALLAEYDPTRATRLVGSAAAVRFALGAQLTPTDREQIERWQPSAVRHLGQPAYSIALQEGEGRVLEESVADAIDAAAIAANAHPLAPALTAREREVAALLEQGLTNRLIAQALVISEGTVRIHVQHVLAKLGVSSRAQVATSTRRPGLVPAHVS
jgi:predicted ATPase/DNA-binding CsgD family transcriptional regulator/DNA-binding XRE family transcriptional regulator